MKSIFCRREYLIISILLLVCPSVFANENSFREARSLQREGKFDQAIEAYKCYLTEPFAEDELKGQELVLYTDALVQFMNTYQSKGEPEACVTALQELFEITPALQTTCLRDYYSVLGYALSRTENMADAEKVMLLVFLTVSTH